MAFTKIRWSFIFGFIDTSFGSQVQLFFKEYLWAFFLIPPSKMAKYCRWLITRAFRSSNLLFSGKMFYKLCNTLIPVAILRRFFLIFFWNVTFQSKHSPRYLTLEEASIIWSLTCSFKSSTASFSDGLENIMISVSCALLLIGWFQIT